MAGKTVKVPYECPGGHRAAPGEVEVAMMQAAPGVTKWYLSLDYGCDRCSQKHFSLILDALPEEVRDFQGKPVRIVKKPPVARPYSDDQADEIIRRLASGDNPIAAAIRRFQENPTKEAVEELYEHLAELHGRGLSLTDLAALEPAEGGKTAKKGRARRKIVEEAKRLYVEAAHPDSASAREVAAAMNDSEREEFGSWLETYRRADELLEAIGGGELPDDQRAARIAEDAVPGAFLERALAHRAWREAYADAGVVIRQDGSQAYVGVKEARKRFARTGSRGAAESLDRAKRDYVEASQEQTRQWSPDVDSLPQSELQGLASWMEAYNKALQQLRETNRMIEAAMRRAEATGDVSNETLVQAVASHLACRRAFAELGVTIEDGTLAYVGVKKARKAVPDDPAQLLRQLSR